MKIARLTSFVLAAAAAAVLRAGAAQAAMKNQWIDYKQGNTVLSGYLVYDDAIQGKRPAVLMIHDRSGFSEGTIADAEMIAKLGYVVFAEDIFGKGIVPKTVPEMTETITIYNNDRPLMRGRASAGTSVSGIFSAQVVQSRRTNRWATTPLRTEAILKASIPMSRSRTTAEAASLVCSVESTRCPVSDACTAIWAVSRSRISPISTTFGSCRRIERSAEANVSPAFS